MTARMNDSSASAPSASAAATEVVEMPHPPGPSDLSSTPTSDISTQLASIISSLWSLYTHDTSEGEAIITRAEYTRMYIRMAGILYPQRRTSSSSSSASHQETLHSAAIDWVRDTSSTYGRMNLETYSRSILDIAQHWTTGDGKGGVAGGGGGIRGATASNSIPASTTSDLTRQYTFLSTLFHKLRRPPATTHTTRARPVIQSAIDRLNEIWQQKEARRDNETRNAMLRSGGGGGRGGGGGGIGRGDGNDSKTEYNSLTLLTHSRLKSRRLYRDSPQARVISSPYTYKNTSDSTRLSGLNATGTSSAITLYTPWQPVYTGRETVEKLSHLTTSNNIPHQSIDSSRYLPPQTQPVYILRERESIEEEGRKEERKEMFMMTKKTKMKKQGGLTQGGGKKAQTSAATSGTNTKTRSQQQTQEEQMRENMRAAVAMKYGGGINGSEMKKHQQRGGEEEKEESSTITSFIPYTIPTFPTRESMSVTLVQEPSTHHLHSSIQPSPPPPSTARYMRARPHSAATSRMKHLSAHNSTIRRLTNSRPVSARDVFERLLPEDESERARMEGPMIALPVTATMTNATTTLESGSGDENNKLIPVSIPPRKNYTDVYGDETDVYDIGNESMHESNNTAITTAGGVGGGSISARGGSGIKSTLSTSSRLLQSPHHRQPLRNPKLISSSIDPTASLTEVTQQLSTQQQQEQKRPRSAIERNQLHVGTQLILNEQGVQRPLMLMSGKCAMIDVDVVTDGGSEKKAEEEEKSLLQQTLTYLKHGISAATTTTPRPGSAPMLRRVFQSTVQAATIRQNENQAISSSKLRIDTGADTDPDTNNPTNENDTTFLTSLIHNENDMHHPTTSLINGGDTGDYLMPSSRNASSRSDGERSSRSSLVSDGGGDVGDLGGEEQRMILHEMEGGSIAPSSHVQQQQQQQHPSSSQQQQQSQQPLYSTLSLTTPSSHPIDSSILQAHPQLGLACITIPPTKPRARDESMNDSGGRRASHPAARAMDLRSALEAKNSAPHQSWSWFQRLAATPSSSSSRSSLIHQQEQDELYQSLYNNLLMQQQKNGGDEDGQAGEIRSTLVRDAILTVYGGHEEESKENLSPPSSHHQPAHLFKQPKKPTIPALLFDSLPSATVLNAFIPETSQTERERRWIRRQKKNQQVDVRSRPQSARSLPNEDEDEMMDDDEYNDEEGFFSSHRNLASIQTSSTPILLTSTHNTATRYNLPSSYDRELRPKRETMTTKWRGGYDANGGVVKVKTSGNNAALLHQQQQKKAIYPHQPRRPASARRSNESAPPQNTDPHSKYAHRDHAHNLMRRGVVVNHVPPPPSDSSGLEHQQPQYSHTNINTNHAVPLEFPAQMSVRVRIAPAMTIGVPTSIDWRTKRGVSREMQQRKPQRAVTMKGQSAATVASPVLSAVSSPLAPTPVSSTATLHLASHSMRVHPEPQTNASALATKRKYYDPNQTALREEQLYDLEEGEEEEVEEEEVETHRGIQRIVIDSPATTAAATPAPTADSQSQAGSTYPMPFVSAVYA